MRVRDYGNVKKLPDEYETGYGYDFSTGDSLYIVALVDCFSPPSYFIRCDADDWETLTDMAEEVLCPSADDDPDLIAGVLEAEDKSLEEMTMSGEWFRYSASGRLIWGDDANRIVYIPFAGEVRR